MKTHRVLVALFAIFPAVLSYRILVVFPTASFSHQRAQISLSKALAAHGHHVTVMTTDPFETDSPNIRQISLRFLYEDTGKMIQTMAVSDFTIKQMFEFFKPKMRSMIQDIFTNEGVRSVLDDPKQQFDAVLVENLGYIWAHTFADKYDAALIGMTTLEMPPFAHKALGNPSHPVLHPIWMYPVPENPNIFDRIKMVWDNYDYTSMMEESMDEFYPIMQEFVPNNTRSVKELMERVEFSIECVSPAQGFVRPILPNTKQIGFMHIEPPKPLPKDLQDFLDSSHRGVVYVSFGSNVKSVNLGHDLMDILRTAIGELPFDVLWKFENGSMPNKPDNVKTIKWSPQMDLLAHPKIRVFVTQGGIQSIDETTARGVPIVVVPFFGDQEFNAGHIERLGIGRKILKKDLTVAGLKSLIMEVERNPRYRKRIGEVADQVRDTPMNATETAVWYIEHAIRNRGTDMFKYKGKSVPFHQYYLLDIIGLAFAVAMAVIVAIHWVFRALFRRKSRSKAKQH